MRNNVTPVLQGSYYGTLQQGSRLAHVDGARLAAPSGPYLGRGSKCSGNDDTCEAPKAKGTDMCVGHLRSAGLLKKGGKDAEVNSPTDS
jgi:hypothetical protein